MLKVFPSPNSLWNTLLLLYREVLFLKCFTFSFLLYANIQVGLEGSVIGHWWLDTIGKCLDEGNTFERMGSRQLAGLLIVLW